MLRTRKSFSFATGPNGNESKQPVYPGFERDVLRTVGDYFQRLKEPLLTFHLYEVFVNILSECNEIRIVPGPVLIVLVADGFPLRLNRSAPAAGRGHWSSSSELPLAAAAKSAATSASTASNGPSLPESPPSSAQWLNRNPHTGTVAWTGLLIFKKKYLSTTWCVIFFRAVKKQFSLINTQKWSAGWEAEGNVWPFLMAAHSRHAIFIYRQNKVTLVFLTLQCCTALLSRVELAVWRFSFIIQYQSEKEDKIQVFQIVVKT